MEKESANNQKIHGLGFEENEKIRKAIEKYSTALSPRAIQKYVSQIKESYGLYT